MLMQNISSKEKSIFINNLEVSEPSFSSKDLSLLPCLPSSQVLPLVQLHELHFYPFSYRSVDLESSSSSVQNHCT